MDISDPNAWARIATRERFWFFLEVRGSEIPSATLLAARLERHEIGTRCNSRDHGLERRADFGQPEDRTGRISLHDQIDVRRRTTGYPNLEFVLGVAATNQ
jgi:hypothetical protein